MKRVAIYLRVSTSKQDTDNQRRELEAVATRSVPRRAQPSVVFLDRGEDHRHRLGMDPTDLDVRFAGEEREDVGGDLALLRLADRRPVRPETGEGEEGGGNSSFANHTGTFTSGEASSARTGPGMAGAPKAQEKPRRRRPDDESAPVLRPLNEKQAAIADDKSASQYLEEATKEWLERRAAKKKG